MLTYRVTGTSWVNRKTVDVHVTVTNRTWAYWRLLGWDGTGKNAEDLLRSVLKAYCKRRAQCLEPTA